MTRAVPMPAGLAVLALALASLGGCDSGGTGGEATTMRDSAGVRIVENGAATARDTWSLGREPVTEIGRVQGPSEYQFDGIRDVERTPDGRIVVADFGSASLMYYDSAGRHLQTAGGRGGGPGEFRYLTDIELVAGDTILAWDYRLERLSVFTGDGQFVRSRQYRPPEEASILTFLGTTGGGTPVFSGRTSSSSGSSVVRRDRIVHLYGDGRSPGRRIARYPGSEQFRWGYELRGKEAFLILPYPFGTTTSLTVGEERVCAATGGRYQIRCHALSGDLRTIVRMEHPRPPVSGEAVDRFIEDVVSGIDSEEFRTRAEEAYDGLESVPDRMPSVDRLKVDAAGNLWVREYRPRYRQGDRTWAVFDADGRRRASIRLPESFQPHHVGDGIVAGSWEDDLGVEYVRVYRLRK